MSPAFKTKISLLALLLVALTTMGLGCKGQSIDVTAANAPLTLKIWRTWDDQEDFSQIMASYKAAHPNVSFEYRRFRFEEYEQALLQAFAEDRGPDIFSIHNTWLKKYQTKILPLPPTITLPYTTVKTRLGFKKETVVELKTTRALTANQIKDNFFDVVYSDVVLTDPADAQNKVYGLPLSVDSLVMFYNRDLLNAAGIPEPAQTWEEFQDHVKKISKEDKQGKLLIAGAGLGTGYNVAHSFDILSLLMMQNGTEMARDKTILFNTIPAAFKDRDIPPGQEALIFYTDFATPSKEVYTWNDKQPNSLDAFIAGNTAYFFGFSYDLATIKNRAPKLNLGYREVPQIEGNPPVNVANYWVETVAKKTAHPNEAWDFVSYMTSAGRVDSYLEKTKKPTALRSLYTSQIEAEELAAFVSQLPTAKNWYKGLAPEVAEAEFKAMIEAVVMGTKTVPEALNLAAGRIQQAF